jgi:hypothetical protein
VVFRVLKRPSHASCGESYLYRAYVGLRAKARARARARARAKA